MKTVGQKQTASAEIREREQQEEKFRLRDEDERANVDEAKPLHTSRCQFAISG